MKPIASLLLAILMLAIPAVMGQDAAYWISQTKSDYNNGSYSLALDDIDQYLKINQSDTWGWNFRANLLLKMERYQEALESFDMVIALDPSNSEAYNDRALILSGAKNQDEEALASLETALQIDSLNANTWYNKGMILEKIGRYNQSLEAYTRAADLDEDLGRAWHRLGHVLMLTGRYSDSLPSLEKAIELDSGNAEVWNDMGMVLMKLERNDEAQECFQKAAQLDPTNALYQQNLNDRGALAAGDLAVNVRENIMDFSATNGQPSLTVDDVKDMLPRKIAINVTVEGDDVDVLMPFQDNLFGKSSILFGTKMDAANIFQELFKDSRVNSVTVRSQVQLIDKYGNTETGMGTIYTMKSTTAAKINWDNFLYDNLDDVADYVFIHPALQGE